MAENVIIIGRYSDASAAHLALARLQWEGIRAILTGEEPSSIFPGNALMAQYQLQVAESDRQRALELLIDEEGAELDPDWEAHVEKEGGWVCTLCGSSNQDHVEICPDCFTDRGALRAESPNRFTSVPRITRQESLETVKKEEPAKPIEIREPESAAIDHQIDIPDEDDLRIDSVLARRAMIAAVGGLACLILSIYSIYLLLKIGRLEGSLTPRAERQVWLAVIINIFWFGFFALIGLTMFSWRR